MLNSLLYKGQKGEAMVLRRKILDYFHNWKENRQGTTALLIEGARRVGKSYAAKVFAESAYKSYILIDFANAKKSVRQIFEEDSSDLDLFFNKLSALYGVKLYPRNSLFIFDEVQLFPPARQLIKYLVADGRFDYIETGSLLSIKRNVSEIVIPSEEESVIMHPLDFEEFLWAMGNDTLGDFIRECFEKEHPLGSLHKTAMDYFRQYMLVGGMPQSVLTYVQTKNFENSDRIKRDILKLYQNDIGKYAGVYAAKVRSIFSQIPSQLSRHEKRFMLASLKKEARMRDYEDAFLWLDDAKVASICFNNTDPNVGLGLDEEHSTLKCYLLDTGLLFSLAFADQTALQEDVYRAILFDKLEINEGMFFENMVAQMLSAGGHSLYFYSRVDNQNAENRIEIDFLIRRGAGICPVEAKSAYYQKHSSLDKFLKKFSRRTKEGIIIYTKDFKKEGAVTYLPVYMTSCL